MSHPLCRSGSVRTMARSLAVGVCLALILGSSAAAATGGTRLWVSRYNGPGNSADAATSLAPSPDGSKVFVTGVSNGGATHADYATVAYDTSTGAAIWVARYNGPANGKDASPFTKCTCLAGSPDGSKVFVTGASPGTTTGYDYATVAYDASSGAQLWVARYNGPANGNDYATSIASSPDGSKVFVTGFSGASGGIFDEDYATVAYDAATGARLWVSRYSVPGTGQNIAKAVVPSPDGSKVFVTGSSLGTTSYDYATVAYDAATGARLWAARYHGRGNSLAFALAVTPNGSTVVATGTSVGMTGDGYGTVAYRAGTGARLWVARYSGPGPDGRQDTALSVATTPSGSEVVVTGFSTGSTTGFDYATVAYNTVTGARVWARRYNGPANRSDGANSVAVTPDGSEVLVTGGSQGTTTGFDYATVAYDAMTGTEIWARRYNGPASLTDSAFSVTSIQGKVFVTGVSTGTTTGTDYATVVYAA
jgi:WD40 repeat protein